MNRVLTIVLGGGRGTRLFPLTHHRSKPAVPIGGKYRLIDIPLSNCLHAGLQRIYVLTQFNSASLNRHVAQTYRMDLFSGGFVEVLAAEQTPEGEQWFQGTADAVRQAARHFREVDADYYLVLAGDHVYRMDFSELIESHIDRDADSTIAAQPVSAEEAPQMGIFRFDAEGQIVGFEEKPNPERLAEMGSSAPMPSPGGLLAHDKPFVASPLTKPGEFTPGIEGPACDAAGNIYAVNFAKQQTIGKVTPKGIGEIFVTLPGESTGNGIVFDKAGRMYIADYVGHNVLRVDRNTKKIDVFAHEATMNQPIAPCAPPRASSSTRRGFSPAGTRPRSQNQAMPAT